MSHPKPSPKLPANAILELYQKGLYRWRLPGEPWTYCLGRESFLPLAQDHEGGLLLHELPRERISGVNALLKRLSYLGSFHTRGGEIWYESRWPMLPERYFPGMVVTSEGYVLNGAWQEQESRASFRRALPLYRNMILNYLRYRSRYPLPDEERDCAQCLIGAEETMYLETSHQRRHLLRYEMPGTLLWHALEEHGYTDRGKLEVLGYLAPPRPLIMVEALEGYFRKRGGF